MSLFLHLAAMVSMAFLLQDAPAIEVITAPSTVTDDIAGLETREQGPTAWICTVLTIDSPWSSYANIRGYLEGGNAEGKDYSNLVLYPVMELFHATESRLCVYLPAADHCYPPAPNNNQVKAVKQLYKKNYTDMRFWGQASDIRVQYYKQKLIAALTAQNKEANFDLFFVSYFSDHVREVRYDIPTVAPQSEISQNEALFCPTNPNISIPGSVTEMAGEEYVLTTLPESRLTMCDVQTKMSFEAGEQSQEGCAAATSSGGENAFSFVNETCKVYSFQRNFCPCAPGDFEIYINRNRFGDTKEFTRETATDELFHHTVIYSANQVLAGYYAEGAQQLGPSRSISECEKLLLEETLTLYFGVVMDNQCYMTFAMDLPNCNRACIGQPMEAIIETKVLQDRVPPLISLCGTEMSVGESFYAPMPSHAGFGCYLYEEAKSLEEEDCVVTFVRKGPMYLQLISASLSRDDDTCHDVLGIYDGVGGYHRRWEGCNLYPNLKNFFTVTGSFTVKFHREQGKASTETNYGFSLMIL